MKTGHYPGLRTILSFSFYPFFAFLHLPFFQDERLHSSNIQNLLLEEEAEEEDVGQILASSIEKGMRTVLSTVSRASKLPVKDPDKTEGISLPVPPRILIPSPATPGTPKVQTPSAETPQSQLSSSGTPMTQAPSPSTPGTLGSTGRATPNQENFEQVCFSVFLSCFFAFSPPEN